MLLQSWLNSVKKFLYSHRWTVVLNKDYCCYNFLLAGKKILKVHMNAVKWWNVKTCANAITLALNMCNLDFFCMTSFGHKFYSQPGSFYFGCHHMRRNLRQMIDLCDSKNYINMKLGNSNWPWFGKIPFKSSPEGLLNILVWLWHLYF